MSDAKIQKIAFGSLAGLAAVTSTGLIVAPFLLPASPFIALASIPFAIGSGLSLWKVTLIRDYDDPKELKNYQKECLSMSWENCLNKHGDHVFSHHLLGSQEDFTKKYLSFEQTIDSLKTLIPMRENLAQQLRKNNSHYELPELDLTKYREQCQNLTFAQIEQQHTLDHLFTYQLLSPDVFLEKYERHESSLSGLPEIIALYNRTRSCLGKCEQGKHYAIPSYERLLPALRLTCTMQSLPSLIQLHGYSNLFIFRLLSPELFSTKYQEYTEALVKAKDFKSVPSFYETTRRALSQGIAHGEYSIPDPSTLSRLWYEETKEASLTSILNEYNLEQLTVLGILKKGKYQTLLLRLRDDRNLVEKNYHTECNEAVIRYQRRSEAINHEIERKNAESDKVLLSYDREIETLENINKLINKDTHKDKIAHNLFLITKLKNEKNLLFIEKFNRNLTEHKQQLRKAADERILDTQNAKARRDKSLDHLDRRLSEERAQLLERGCYYPTTA